MRLHLPLLAAGFVLLAAGALAQTLTRVANLPVTGIPNDIAITGNRAYVSDFGNATLQSYNIGTPAAPALLGSVAASTRPRAVAASGSMAYILGYGIGTSTSSQLNSFNVTNPAAPMLGQGAVLDAPPVYIAAGGSLVCAASASGTVKVFDSTLNLLSSFSRNATDVVINGNALYLSFYGSVSVYDLTNPTTPVFVRTVAGAIGAVSGNRACGLYQPNSTSNLLYSYDVSVPLNPVVLGSTTVANGYNLVATSPTTAFIGQRYEPIVSTNNLPLQAFAIGAATAPVLQATAGPNSTATSIAVVGNAAYLVHEYTNNLQVYALSGTPTATRDPQSIALGLYPNPAHTSLAVTLPNPNSPVIIYDLAGRARLTAQVATGAPLDISALTPGVYVVRNGTAVQSLVVE